MTVSRSHILAELKRVASEHGGKAPGRARFATATGIRQTDWLGIYWARWGDAVREAGLEPNTLAVRIDDTLLLQALIDEIRRLGRFPTAAELRMRHRVDPLFPAATTFDRLGRRSHVVEQLRKQCESEGTSHADVVAILAESFPASVPSASTTDDHEVQQDRDIVFGYVYLIQSGRHYKIGRTNAIGRRERELAIQLPERARTVHSIATDDPPGIEAYWHRRFSARRVRPDAEWFNLAPEDVTAFKRRKFQ